MKCLIPIVLLTLTAFVNCEHFVVGNVANRVKLVNHTLVEYNAIPFMKRVKYFFYSDALNRKITVDGCLPDCAMQRGIQALDTLYSKASINVTAGGVGSSFVNLRLKSERGRGLSYDVGIYVNEDLY